MVSVNAFSKKNMGACDAITIITYNVSINQSIDIITESDLVVITSWVVILQPYRD